MILTNKLIQDRILSLAVDNQLPLVTQHLNNQNKRSPIIQVENWMVNFIALQMFSTNIIRCLQNIILTKCW